MGNRAKQRILNEETQMSKKHLKKCSASLVIKEMQIKTTLRCHLKHIRMAKIKTQVTADDSENMEKETLLHYWWDCKLVQPLWKSVWWFLRKLDIVLPDYVSSFGTMYISYILIYLLIYTNS